MSQFLISINGALRALAEARIPEQLIDTAETLRRYAQQARLGNGGAEQMRRYSSFERASDTVVKIRPRTNLR